jgi:hypothetical protein
MVKFLHVRNAGIFSGQGISNEAIIFAAYE